MEAKLNKTGIVKSLLFILPLLFFMFFAYNKTKLNIFLYVFVFYFAALLLYSFILIIKHKADLCREKEEIYQLKKVIEKQDLELEAIQQKSISMNEDVKAFVEKIKLDLTRKEEELNVLREASEMVTSTFDMGKIIEYLYKVFNKFIGCDRYLVSFVDRATGDVICKYECGSITLNSIGCLMNDDSLVQQCFQDKKIMIGVDVLLDSRKTNGDKMIIPLRVLEEMVGVIYIECDVPQSFCDANIKFFESLASYAAIALNNAELFSNISRQKQEIEELYQQTAAVNEELGSYIHELNRTKEELREKNGKLTLFYNEMQTGYLQTVMALANSIEAKDPYTRGHCQRVMEISCEIAKTMGYSEEDVEDLRYAAILHDIGKIGISANILNKAEKLTDEEFEEIKKHPQIAYNILKDVEFIRNGLDAILQHHERVDGRGYPHRIGGTDISIFGKILCVADAFDAMTSDRPYRKGMTMKEAVQEIERCKGTQFDPKIADIFIEMSKPVIEDEEKLLEGEVAHGRE